MNGTFNPRVRTHVVQEHTEKPAHKNKLRFGFGISPTEWILSVIAGLGSAVIAAIITIHSRFNDDVRNSEDIKEQEQIMKDRIKLILKKKEYTEDITKLHDQYREAKTVYANAIEEYTYGSMKISRDFFTGTKQRMDTFIGRSRKAITSNAIFGSIIGVAAAISFFNSVAIRDKINQVDNILEPKDEPKHPHTTHHGIEDEKRQAKTKPDHKVTEAHSEKTLEAKREHSLAS